MKTMFGVDPEGNLGYVPEGVQMTPMGPFDHIVVRSKKEELIAEMKNMYIQERCNMRRLLLQEPGEDAEFAIQFYMRGYLSAVEEMVRYLEENL